MGDISFTETLSNRNTHDEPLILPRRASQLKGIGFKPDNIDTLMILGFRTSKGL